MSSTLDTPRSDKCPVAPTRRAFLYVATGAWTATGAIFAIWPIIDSMNPSADVAALSTTELNLADISVGQRVTIMWQGKPVFIDRRTPEQIARARAGDLDSDLIDPARDADRVVQPEWLIIVGICTHLGCVPLGQRPTDTKGSYGGWFCPCHGSVYDTSGRIRQGPAPRNLDVPPYTFLSAQRVRIG